MRGHGVTEVHHGAREVLQREARTARRETRQRRRRGSGEAAGPSAVPRRRPFEVRRHRRRRRRPEAHGFDARERRHHDAPPRRSRSAEPAWRSSRASGRHDGCQRPEARRTLGVLSAPGFDGRIGYPMIHVITCSIVDRGLSGTHDERCLLACLVEAPHRNETGSPGTASTPFVPYTHRGRRSRALAQCPDEFEPRWHGEGVAGDGVETDTVLTTAGPGERFTLSAMSGSVEVDAIYAGVELVAAPPRAVGA